MTPEELEKINDGRKAGFILSEISPLLSTMREAILSKMKGDYRSGALDHAKLLSATAELCVLDDIVSRLKSKINFGESISKRVGE